MRVAGALRVFGQDLSDGDSKHSNLKLIKITKLEQLQILTETDDPCCAPRLVGAPEYLIGASKKNNLTKSKFLMINCGFTFKWRCQFSDRFLNRIWSLVVVKLFNHCIIFPPDFLKLHLEKSWLNFEEFL